MGRSAAFREQVESRRAFEERVEAGDCWAGVWAGKWGGIVLMTALVTGHGVADSAIGSATNRPFSEGTKWEFGG